MVSTPPFNSQIFFPSLLVAHTISEGLLKYIIGLISKAGVSSDLQTKAFEMLLKMDGWLQFSSLTLTETPLSASRQEDMVNEGILAHLIGLIAAAEEDSHSRSLKLPAESPGESKSENLHYLDILEDLLDPPSPGSPSR